MKKLILITSLLLLLPKLVFADITTGLIGYWKFDEGTGTTSTDSSGNGNTATFATGSVTKNTWLTPGKVGPHAVTGFTNNGSGTNTDYQIITTTLTTALNDFTACAWFNNSGNVNEYMRIVDKDYNNGFWMGKIVNLPNSWGGGIRNSDNNFFLSVQFPNDIPTWHHICMGRKGTTQFVYGDGGTYYTQATVLSTATNTAAVSIGNDIVPTGGSPTSDEFNGSIDDVRIYSRALSSRDVLELYNYTFGKIQSRSGTIRNAKFNI